jgi:plasmid replication initiation protein
MDLSFEEIKEGRKVTSIMFTFKPVKVTQVVNQKTGQTTNIYDKPKRQVTIKKRVKKVSLPDAQAISEKQLPFIEPKPEVKPMKNILSSIISKFMPSKK